jgi:EF-P beta-lysylation protein EpmB
MVLEVISLAETVVSTWKSILRTNITDAGVLARYLVLTEEQQQEILVRPKFVLNLPMRLAHKIEKGTLDDPILKQFLPSSEEEHEVAGYSCDPVADASFKETHKLLRKYQGRALILCTSACAMHCRYCFRQNFDYDVSVKGFDAPFKNIAADDTVHEVILSGGDPLSLDNATLAHVVGQLEDIPHVKKLRFHTRFPIGIPERIDSGLLDILANTRLQVWFCIHTNHPKELDADILAALKKVQKLGIPVVNQSVLLKGINDSADTLVELCELLSDNGIIPYYLHQLDRVKGSSRFEVAEDVGIALVKEIAKRLPGYAVPRYTKEVAGAPGKVFLA